MTLADQFLAPPPLSMSSSTDSVDAALQVCFGVLGLVGVLVAIASISETSLGASVYRRLRGDLVRGIFK